MCLCGVCVGCVCGVCVWGVCVVCVWRGGNTSAAARLPGAEREAKVLTGVKERCILPAERNGRVWFADGPTRAIAPSHPPTHPPTPPHPTHTHTHTRSPRGALAPPAWELPAHQAALPGCRPGGRRGHPWPRQSPLLSGASERLAMGLGGVREGRSGVAWRGVVPIPMNHQPHTVA